jgi:hypothetical protein
VRTVHDAQHVGAGATAATRNSVVGSGSEVVVGIVVLGGRVVAGALVVGCPTVVVGSVSVVVDAEVVVLEDEVEVVVLDVVVVDDVVVEPDGVVVVGSSGSAPACAGRLGASPIRPVNAMASVSPPNERTDDSPPPNMGTGDYYAARLDRRRGTGRL